MEREVIFSLGPIGFTPQMLTLTGIVILLCVIGFIAGRKPKLIPQGLQNVMELVIEKLEGFFGQMMGPELIKQYLPLIGTTFILILLCNYSGLLPMMQVKLPGFAAPTSSINITAGFAIGIFLATHILGFKHNGVHYLGHFVSPYFFMLPFLLLEEIVRPISLALRLYGNVFGEETVSEQIFEMVPVIAPLVFSALGLLFGLIQALVFTMLSSVYIAGACSKGH